MRAGTTSFFEILRSHRAIYTAPIKEPNYFIENIPTAVFKPLPKGFVKGYFQNIFPNPIHRAHIQNESDYHKLYSFSNDENYLAEASSLYLHAPRAAASIHRYNNEAKIIIITRDPIKRAFSHYKMDRNMGRIKVSFEVAMQTEVAAFEKKRLPWHSYLAMSQYAKKIKEYESFFGKNVLVISHEALFNNTEVELAHVSKFLDIETFKNQSIEVNNASRKHRFGYLQRRLLQSRLIDLLSSQTSSNFKNVIKKLMLVDDTSTPKITSKLRKSLTSILIKDI